MKEKPILFSTPMIQAILDNHKSMTRRVIKKIPLLTKLFGYDLTKWLLKCPYGQVGDRLWVRETFATEDKFNDKPMSFFDKSGDVPIWYKANEDGLIDYVLRGKWRPSIFMPRWASRITLEITNIRVERVQDIKHEYILLEGWDARCSKPFTNRTAGEDAKDWFKILWDKLNSKRGYSWESNPFVWVIEFKRV